MQNESYCGYFTWIDPKIKNRAKTALLKKRDEARDLKVEVENCLKSLEGIERKFRFERTSVGIEKRDNRLVRKGRCLKKRRLLT